MFLTITGNKGAIEKVQLKENKAKKTPFEKGKLDEFEINGTDVGTVKLQFSQALKSLKEMIKILMASIYE